jgi:HNH endonuclease
MTRGLQMVSIDEAMAFYKSYYEVTGSWSLRRGKREVALGSAEVRYCRFCGRRPPLASFSQVAHAVPEALGNGTLFSNYECDSCNQVFGRGIENDFGNWSKPMRTIARVRGKSGVPTLKGSQGKWRIENGRTGLDISHDRIDQVFDCSSLYLILQTAPFLEVVGSLLILFRRRSFFPSQWGWRQGRFAWASCRSTNGLDAASPHCIF